MRYVKKPRIVAGVWTWQCARCKEFKPDFDFHAGNCLNGLNSWCKECNRDYVRQWAKERPETVRAYARNWRRKNKDRARQHARKWRSANPVKVAAHRITRIALQAGIIQLDPVCKRCGTAEELEAHHENHYEPLLITTYCHPCHIDRHTELRALG